MASAKSKTSSKGEPKAETDAGTGTELKGKAARTGQDKSPSASPSEGASKAPSADAPKTAPAPEAQRLKVIDNPTITEQFANQVLDVLLINGSTVSITLGAKRNIREALSGSRETVIAVNTRLTVDIQTAETLRNALNKVLLMARQPQGGIN
jgi:hypothetical protein